RLRCLARHPLRRVPDGIVASSRHGAPIAISGDGAGYRASRLSSGSVAHVRVCRVLHLHEQRRAANQSPLEICAGDTRADTRGCARGRLDAPRPGTRTRRLDCDWRGHKGSRVKRRRLTVYRPGIAAPAPADDEDVVALDDFTGWIREGRLARVAAYREGRILV